jgi:hypothetical protein
MDGRKYPEPKMPDWLMISGFIGFIGLDILSAVPALNWATTMVAAAINIIVTFTGIGGVVLVFAYVTGWIIEVIPVLSILPTLTAVWGLTVIFDRHPEWLPEWVRKKIEQAAKVAQAAKGKGGGVAKGGSKEVVGGMRSGVQAGREAAAAERAAAGETRGQFRGRLAAEASGGAGEAGEEEALGGGKRRKKGGRDGGEGGPEEEGPGEEEGGEGKEEEALSPELRDLMNILSGDPFGKRLLHTLTLEDILSRVGEQKRGEKPSQFDSDLGITKSTPKPASGQAADNRYNKEVNLKDGQQ